MALNPFWIERGLRIGDADSDTSTIDLVQGSGAPSATSEQNEAGVGSIYFRKDSGDFYRKIATGNAPADWERISSDKANDMFLTATYDNTGNGSPADGDSLEDALGFLDANQLDIITLSGVAKGDTDLGTFSGNTIQDNRTIKQALQDLETGLEGVSGGSKDSALGVTTATRLGACLVDDCDSAEWEVLIVDAATPANKKKIKISSLHDGDATSDATVVDSDKFGKLKVGSNFNATLDVTLSGTGVTQDIAVEVSSTEPSGVNVYVRRTTLP